jgi:hypothetical protein
MNGVSRFLSRRDKHGEKRHSKLGRSSNKVSILVSSSPVQSSSKASSIDGSAIAAFPTCPGRGTDSLSILCHQLPSMLRTHGGDNVLFPRKGSASAHVISNSIQASNMQSSDYITLQSHHPVPPNLYTIFSNDDVKITEQEQVSFIHGRKHISGLKDCH